MAGSGNLPDFLVIGALKCGTTWLDLQLREHRDLHLPSTIKEINFFTREYARGLDWYRSFWADAPVDRHPGARRGEVSPGYFANPEAAARIRRHLPEVRLVVVLREPVRRLYSQYTFWIQDTGYAGDFETYVVEHGNAVETGFYDVHIRRFMELFPREQLKIVIFEEMITSPADILRELRPHLGVPADGPWSVADIGKVNRTARPLFPRYSRAARKAAACLRGRNADWIVDVGGRLGFRDLAYRGRSFPEMPEEAREAYRRVYRPHVRALESFLGRRIEVWRDS